MSKQKVNRIRTERTVKPGSILLIISIGAVIAIIAVLIINAISGRTLGSKINVSTAEEEAEVDVIPYGDENADTYDYAGDYFDMATQKGTMVIERDGTSYNITVTYAETDDTLSVWSMTAAYSKDRKALIYRDATRKDYIFSEPVEADTTEEADAAAETSGIAVSEAYTDGTGMFYLSNDSIFWIDEREDMGTGLMFEKVESTE